MFPNCDLMPGVLRFLIHLKQSHLSILTKSRAGILYKKKDFNYSFKLYSKKNMSIEMWICVHRIILLSEAL